MTDFRAAWSEGEIEAGTLLDEIERLRAELAAAQAREAMWRQAFETSRDAILHNRGALEEGLDSDSTNAVLSELDDAFSPVLDLPHDHTALNERLKAERERNGVYSRRRPVTPNDLGKRQADGSPADCPT